MNWWAAFDTPGLASIPTETRLCQVQTNSSDLDDRLFYGEASKFRTNGSANKLPSQWPASRLYLTLSRPSKMRVERRATLPVH